MKNCKVTQYKKVVNANLKRIGEAWITVLAGKTITIKWNSFNAETDSVRIVSGEGTTTSVTGGIEVTAGAGGCVVGASERYRINNINSSGKDIAYVIDALDFATRSTPISTMSRAKIVGNITKMFEGNTMGWFEHFDMSEASGVFPVATDIVNFVGTVGNSDTVISCPNVELSFSGQLTRPSQFKGIFKTANMPISYLANSSIATFFGNSGNTSVALTGNISDLGICSSLTNINVNGPLLVGDLGSYIASYAATKSSGGIRFLNTNKSGMTIHGITMAGNNDFKNGGVLAIFSASEIVVKYKEDTATLGTYNKSTQTWTWTV